MQASSTRRGRKALPALMLACLMISSCTSAPVPPLELALADVAASPTQPASTEPAAAQIVSASDAALPVPAANPQTASATANALVPPVPPSQVTAADQPVAPEPAQAASLAPVPDAPLDPASARVAAAAGAVPAPTPDPRRLASSPQTTVAAAPVTPTMLAVAAQPALAQPAAVQAVPAPAPTQATPVQPAAPAEQVLASVEPAPKPKQKGFLASLFSQEPPRPQARVTQAPAPAVRTARPAAAAVASRQLVAITPGDPSAAALPGVNAKSLFEINRKSGTYDDSDVDANEEESPVRVASVTGLARLAPNGLAVQHAGVDVACIKPALVKVLKTVERRYGRKVVVTSGYRSPSHNRRARGAKNSLHMYCAAADIQVDGISKWQLAAYLRTMPGRGGVGTYCHTESVHVDIGPERDWNWRCRRSSRK